MTKTKRPILQADWRDDWAPDHPVRVTFGDGGMGYLSLEAAAARVATITGKPDAWAAAELARGISFRSNIGSFYELISTGTTA